MDLILKQKLNQIDIQIEELAKVENDFLTLEAHKDVLFSEMYRKTTSVHAELDHKISKRTQADREAEVYDSPPWTQFSKCLAEQHALFNKERRKYELALKEFDAEYLSYKLNHQAIQRGVGGDVSEEQISSDSDGEFRL